MTNYAIIGDIHSQFEPFNQAIEYCKDRELVPILLGDLFDSRVKTSDSAGVLKLAKKVQEEMGAIILRSNHQHKLEKFARGAKVTISDCLQKTLMDFSEANISVEAVVSWLETLPYGFVFRDSKGREYRCAHAMFPSFIHIPSYDDGYKVDLVSSKARGLMLYGPCTDKVTEHGWHERLFWWENEDHSGRDWVRVAGHYHVVYTSDKSLVLDGGMGGTEQDDPKGVDTLCLWDVESKGLIQFSY